MWTVHGLTYLEVKNVLAQNKMAVWDFLKKWECARKQMFQKTEVSENGSNSGLELWDELWY